MARSTAREAAKATGSLRMLPSFLVCGTKRGGSTSLYEYLIQHPDVAPSLVVKGTHYFDVNFPLGWSWYRTRFPLERPARLTKGRPRITGEGSPYYMFHPLAPSRIAQALPEVKLVVTLRNPVDRAYSHWNYETQRGFETLSFGDAIDAEEGRLAGEVERMRADPTYPALEHRHHSYLARSRYAVQLDHIRTLFPPDRLLVVKSEAMFTNPPAALAGIHAWLGLPTYRAPSYPVYKAREYDGVPPDVRDRLIEVFAADNARLYEDPGVAFRWS